MALDTVKSGEIKVLSSDPSSRLSRSAMTILMQHSVCFQSLYLHICPEHQQRQRVVLMLATGQEAVLMELTCVWLQEQQRTLAAGLISVIPVLDTRLVRFGSDAPCGGLSVLNSPFWNTRFWEFVWQILSQTNRNLVSLLVTMFLLTLNHLLEPFYSFYG